MASGSQHFMANDGEKVETLTNFVFLGSKITRHDCSHKVETHLLCGRKAMMNLAY